VRFLLDQNMSPLVAKFLREAGHDVVHVRDLGFASASDRTILEAAAAQARTIISADTDFGELLAETSASAGVRRCEASLAGRRGNARTCSARCRQRLRLASASK
jgi:hypothetical protein